MTDFLSRGEIVGSGLALPADAGANLGSIIIRRSDECCG